MCSDAECCIQVLLEDVLEDVLEDASSKRPLQVWSGVEVPGPGLRCVAAVTSRYQRQTDGLRSAGITEPLRARRLRFQPQKDDTGQQTSRAPSLQAKPGGGGGCWARGARARRTKDLM